MSQLALPIEVPPREVARKPSLGAAFELCAELAGIEPKRVQIELKTDKAQWSRWASGQEGIVWPKLAGLMDLCGNEAPLLWMCHQRGFDIERMPRVETELERQNRMLREENIALRRVLQAQR